MLRNDESMVYGSIEIDTPGIMLALLDFGWVVTQGLVVGEHHHMVQMNGIYKHPIPEAMLRPFER